jgi:transcriptional regulator with PAS, ATPase and Fis domain
MLMENSAKNLTDLNLENNPSDAFNSGELVAVSGAMMKVLETIKKVSRSDSTAIIYGESGTGKELVAKAIHYNSNRRNNKIVAVNCGAIPEELLESELFGHEKGAFTGAIRSRTGRFELAQGGTIFLDEIGDMSPSLQVKLLRVIQEKVFERVGGVQTIKADIRIISATNQNLEKAVEEKRFREDLFYRINVIPIHLPPLRERRSDIPLLTRHFLKKFKNLNNKDGIEITDDAMKILMDYTWPGNVRELQNLVERIVVLKESGEITSADLPDKILSSVKRNLSIKENDELPDEGIDLGRTMESLEKSLIFKALKKSHGVKSEAAKLLKINRTTLVEKLKRYGGYPFVVQ